MNSGESRAGCSSSGRENGAASLDPERPHKKARFPWEIKGKHHLKNQENQPTASSNVTPEDSETVTAPLAAERNMTEYTTENLPGPSIPTTTSIPYNSGREARLLEVQMKEEMSIAKWQSNQTMNACFDNNINLVIESYLDLPDRIDGRIRAMDMAIIANEGENVVNEGILMAIDAHGLRIRNHSYAPVSPPSDRNPITALSQLFKSESSSSSDSDSDSEILTQSDDLQWLFDEHTNKSEEPANYEPWRPVHEILNPNPTDQFPTAGEDFEHELMNTAVIQAIKSKGLVATGTDFG